METPSLMSYGEHDQLPFCDLVLEHVPLADFVTLVKARHTDVEAVPADRVRYEYATFAPDEKVMLNVRPDAPGAKPVTVVYHRWLPEQDDEGEK